MKIKRFLIKEVQKEQRTVHLTNLENVESESKEKDKDQLLPRFAIAEDDSDFRIVFKKQDSSLFQMTTVKIFEIITRLLDYAIKIKVSALYLRKRRSFLKVICFFNHLSTSWRRNVIYRDSVGIWIGKINDLGMFFHGKKTSITLIDMRRWDKSDWKESDSEYHMEEIDDEE